MSADPYAPPLGAPARLASETSGAATLRRQFLSHEAAVKSVGVLYYVGSALLLTLGGATMFAAVNTDAFLPQKRDMIVGLSFVYLMLGMLLGATAFGLRRLHRWARPLAVLFAMLGLLAFPFGTIISGYILYLLISQKGSVVFSDHYQQIIARTPNIKYKPSFLVLLLLAVLITIAVVSIIAAVAIPTA